MIMKPIFFFGYKSCILIVQIFSATFTHNFYIFQFYIFDLSSVCYFINHFRTKKQLKIKSKHHKPKLEIKTQIKFIHARIIHKS